MYIRHHPFFHSLSSHLPVRSFGVPAAAWARTRLRVPQGPRGGPWAASRRPARRRGRSAKESRSLELQKEGGKGDRGEIRELYEEKVKGRGKGRGNSGKLKVKEEVKERGKYTYYILGIYLRFFVFFSLFVFYDKEEMEKETRRRIDKVKGKEERKEKNKEISKDI